MSSDEGGEAHVREDCIRYICVSQREQPSPRYIVNSTLERDLSGAPVPRVGRAAHDVINWGAVKTRHDWQVISEPYRGTFWGTRVEAFVLSVEQQQQENQVGELLATLNRKVGGTNPKGQTLGTDQPKGITV
jgi:hypothetical protein